MAMTKNPFNGNLNSNSIFSAIYNMIISQEVFADNVKGTYSDLVDMFRVDGTLYGDTKLYYATDALKSVAWTGDSEANNLLSLDRPASPKCQAVTIDTYRQIRLTVDNYLTKQAWSTEGAFASFNSVMLGWIRTTKRIYDATLFNSYVGTVNGAANKNAVVVNLDSASSGDPLYGLNGLEATKQEAKLIAKSLADLIVEMKDVSRDFNDYKYIRSYDLSDLVFIWNSDWVNKITKVDLPEIFHNQGLVDKLAEHTLPSRYFGTIITSTNIDTYADNTPTTGKPLDKDDTYKYTPGNNNANGKVCTLVECDVTVSNVAYHLFPGDELPIGTKLASAAAAGTLVIGEVYIVDPKVICKVVHKKSFPFMSAFEVATSFFNPRSLTENHYLTFGYSSLDYLRNYPIVKISKK